MNRHCILGKMNINNITLFEIVNIPVGPSCHIRIRVPHMPYGWCLGGPSLFPSQTHHILCLIPLSPSHYKLH